MDRREFLTTKKRPAVKHGYTQSRHVSAVGGLAPYTGPWTTVEIAHLLKRTMFGAAKADIDYFKSKSMSAAVDELINPTAPLPPPPVKEYDETGALVPDTNVAAGTTWVNDTSTDGTIISRRRGSFKKWWTGMMLTQDRSIREKMTLFWANHFSARMIDVYYPQLVYKHHNLLRTNSLGNFKDLVKAVTTDPGMLIFLHGRDSLGTAPNEDYARELQELFTIGKENNPSYTEVDVKAAARVLSGWQVDTNKITSSFVIARHDKTNKTFSDFYSKTTITGRTTATAGDQEIDDMLTMIFNKKAEVSRFIVKKLYRWFCYYTITDEVQANVIDPLALIFQNSNWNIKPVLSALFKSQHFYDTSTQGCMIKSPVDFTVSLFREFNVTFPDISLYLDAYGMWDKVREYTSAMNQDIGDPINVSGWPAYYQEPQFYETWVNADTLSKRNKFTDTFIASGYTRLGKTIKIDAVAFTQSLSAPEDPVKLINEVVDILLKVPLSDTAKVKIKENILLSNQVGDASNHYWTDAWTAYKNSNKDPTKEPYMTVNTRLKTLYKYIMNLPEYQLS